MLPEEFITHKKKQIAKMQQDVEFENLTKDWYLAADKWQYSYNFTWMGLPIIQYPQDIMSMQELIFNIKPDVIIETGVARGGSVVFYASMLHLLGENGFVIGIDIDIRDHNRCAINKNRFANKIKLLEGSSISSTIHEKIQTLIPKNSKVLVVLDSCHTHEHVYQELLSFDRYIQKDSYIVVFDTKIHDTDKLNFKNKEYYPGNDPYTAVCEFLNNNQRYVVDDSYVKKSKISECPSGFLKCVQNAAN